MNGFYEPFQFVLAHWWQLVLSILGCALALSFSADLGLQRPWPFPVILGGILSLMILEAFPYAWMLGQYTSVVLWVVMACAAYAMPWFEEKYQEGQRKTIWDDFVKNNDEV